MYMIRAVGKKDNFSCRVSNGLEPEEVKGWEVGLIITHSRSYHCPHSSSMVLEEVTVLSTWSLTEVNVNGIIYVLEVKYTLKCFVESEPECAGSSPRGRSSATSQQVKLAHFG